jgi:hypothetical protein
MVNNWEVVNEKINESRIIRFDYKSLLGESLTSFITKRTHKTNLEIYEEIMDLSKVQNFLLFNSDKSKKFIKNVKTSISSRKAEQGIFHKRKTKVL